MAALVSRCPVSCQTNAPQNLRDTLEANTTRWRAGLAKHGFDVLDGTHPITPIMFYDANKAVAFAEKLLERGIYVTPFSFPVVPQGQARIRTQISAAHSTADIDFALEQFADAPTCDRQVIDISGDGPPNAGSDTRLASREAERRGVTINGIAIESLGVALTNFFSRSLITRDGFVITARRHRDYPRAIREKILREVSRIFG